jgi:hypothetical protein
MRQLHGITVAQVNVGFPPRADGAILEESTIAVLGPMMGVPSDHLLFRRRNLLEPYVNGLTLMVNSIFQRQLPRRHLARQIRREERCH